MDISRGGPLTTGQVDPPLTSLIGPPCLVPRAPALSASKDLRLSQPWPLHSQPPTSTLVSEEPPSCLGQAGPPTQGTDRAVTPDPRWVPGGRLHLPALPPGRSLPLTFSLYVWTAKVQVSQGFLMCF